MRIARLVRKKRMSICRQRLRNTEYWYSRKLAVYLTSVHADKEQCRNCLTGYSRDVCLERERERERMRERERVCTSESNNDSNTCRKRAANTRILLLRSIWMYSCLFLTQFELIKSYSKSKTSNIYANSDIWIIIYTMATISIGIHHWIYHIVCILTNYRFK